MPDPVAIAIVNECLALRQSHPSVPASDVLDLVMQGRHHRHYDFGSAMFPPDPFALVVAEAVDFMPANDWAALTGASVTPDQRAAMQVMWALEVWPKFMKRYSLG